MKKEMKKQRILSAALTLILGVSSALGLSACDNSQQTAALKTTAPTTVAVTATPTPLPTADVTPVPTPAPTPVPTPIPTPEPTLAPTAAPEKTSSGTKSSASQQKANTNTGTKADAKASDTTSYTVYITKTGEKYHASGCQYLKKSKIAISKKDAVSRGYSACSKCRP